MIPLVDLKKQYKTIKKDVQSAIKNVIEKTDFILGEELKKFESEFAEYCQTQFAVGVDSGTGALELALLALGVKPGDEVIVPTFTFYATASSVAAVGARPVFVDVEEDTGNMDPSKLQSAITSKTRAIVPVHLFGQPANLSEILSIAKMNSIPIIEDSAQAHGAKIQINQEWRTAGSIGEMGCFSFYPGKNLGAYGDAGAVVTNNPKHAEKLQLLRDYGRTGKYEHSILGYNRRMDTLQAAILRVKLKKLNEWNEKRKKNGELYDALLQKAGIRIFKIRPFVQTVRHVYAIRVDRRDELAVYLKENGVATGVHYPIPLHLQKAFEYLGYQKGSLPASEKMAEEIISLPIFPELKNSEIKKIVKLIKKFYK